MILKIFWSIFIVQVYLELFENTQKSRLVAKADCLASNCATCNSGSPTCLTCETPFAPNSNGYCSASNRCSLNLLYQISTDTCDQSCLPTQKENSLLNFCDTISSCSNIRYIGNKYLQTEFNAPIFADNKYQIYIQSSSFNLINIYDSTNLQFQAQIQSNMQIISKSVYDSANQNIVITNTSGEIEIWNILSTNLVFQSNAQNYDGTNIFFISDIQLFFYLNDQKYLTIIDDFSKPPKTLRYQLVNLDFTYTYIKETNSIVFAGTQLELLHLDLTTYEPIFQNAYDLSISQVPQQVYRATIYAPNSVFFYRLASPFLSYFYIISTQQWLNTTDVSPLTSGTFLGNIFTRLNSTFIQFITLDNDGKAVIKGDPYPLAQSFFVSYDNNSKGIGLTLGQTATAVGPHSRFNLNMSPDKIFTSEMITSITTFTIQALNFILIDDVNRRLVVRSYEGNLMVIDIDTLELVYCVKQFQQAPYSAFDNASINTLRIDPSNQSSLISATLSSYQNINIYNNKRKFRSEKFSSNFGQIAATKDFLIGMFSGSSNLVAMKLSNMQKIYVTTYTSAATDLIAKCPNPTIPINSLTSNDYVTACKTRMVYATFNSATSAYTMSTYTLKNAVFTFRELNNHLILCYVVDCYYHSKSAFATATAFLTQQSGFITVTTKNDVGYFAVLTSQNKAMIFGYPSWTNVITYTLQYPCVSLFASAWVEDNYLVYACKIDAISLSIQFQILQLITTPTFSIVATTMKVDRITSLLKFLDGSTIISIYTSGAKLYFYIYAFVQGYTQIIEKAQNIVNPYYNAIPTPSFDTTLRKVYFSYTSMVYSNTKFIGEYQIWSYTYKNKFYDVLDAANTGQILKFKRCFYSEYVIGTVRAGQIYINDSLRNKQYNIAVTDVSDIYIDSTINTVFYAVLGQKTLYSYDYTQGIITNQLLLPSLVSDFQSFIHPQFPNTFILYNRSNLDINFCQYTSVPSEMKCVEQTLLNQSIADQTGITVVSLVCYQNVVYISDSKTYSYYMLYNPTDSQNPISLMNVFVSTKNTSKVFPAVGLLIVQQTGNQDGYAANSNGLQLSQIKYPSEIIDIILVDNDYFFIFSKIIYRVQKNFNNLFSISTSMIVKKAVYYAKKNLILIISSQQSFYNYISLYDQTTQLQLQQIQVGLNPLQDIQYLEQEDIFVVYNIYGQIFRIDLNKTDQEEFIVNRLETETGSLQSNYLPIIYFNSITNKIYFANQNTLIQWNYSPFIGERLNFRRIRYLQYNAIQSYQNPEHIYYSDIQNFIWVFKTNTQQLLGISQSDILEMFISQNYLVVFCYQNVIIYYVNDQSNKLLFNSTLTTTAIQMVQRFKNDIFGYITSEFDFFILDITTNPKADPVKISTLPAQPIDMFLLFEDTIIFSLVSSTPVKFKLGDTAFTALPDYPKLKTILGYQTIPSDNSIIILDEKNVLKIDSTTLASKISISFPEYDSAGNIESHAFDDDQNLLYIHYSHENYATIIPYSLNKSQITFIGSCDMYQVKFLIQKDYVCIYCQFQINFHSRNPQLTYLYSMRNPKLVQSMINLNILSDQYLIITQSYTVNIFRMTPVEQGSRTFTLYRTFNSTRSQIFQTIQTDEYNIKIVGVGYEGYFNNIIFMGNSCQNKFTSIKNKLNLKNQLNQINIQEENVQKYYYFDIELDSKTSYTQLPYINELKFPQNNALIQFLPQQTQQSITIYNQLFSDVDIQDLVLNDFTFYIPNNSNNISFHPKTKSVVIKKIIISSDLVNVRFKFYNLSKVVISQLTISDITITDTVLFDVLNVDQFVLSNINIVNTNFVNSQLLNILNSNKITVNGIQLQTIRLLSYSPNMLINIRNTDSLVMSDFFILDLTGEDNIPINQRSSDTVVLEYENLYLESQVNHIIYLQKLKTITFVKGYCSFLKKISMLKIEDFYTDGLILQTLENSQINFSKVNFKSNQAMNSVVAIKGTEINMEYVTANGNLCTDCYGGVFFIYESKILNIKHSEFILNKGIHGGSICHLNCKENANLMYNATFTSNTARGSGGAVYLENCDLQLGLGNFTGNTALIGGAIKYKNLVPLFISSVGDILSTNLFVNNQAKMFGNNYGSYFGRISLEQQDNTVVTGKFNQTTLIHQTYLKDNFSSGDNVNMVVKILDEESDNIKFNPADINSKIIPNSIRTEFQKIILNMVSLKDEILIEGANFATYQQFDQYKKLFIFPTNRLILQPKKEGDVYIQTNIDFEIPDYLLDKLTEEASKGQKRQLAEQTMKQTIRKSQYALQVHLKFRDCIVGEIYQNISDTKTSCFRCPNGTYSLEEPDFFKKQDCNQCNPQNTKECGNNTIVLQDGYWRINQFSDVIVECVNRKENCKDIPSSRDYCSTGLIGPLCEQCDILGDVWGEPYSKTLDYQCSPCTNYFDTYVRWVLIFIGVNIYILGTLYMFFSIYRQKAIVYYLRLAGMICFGNSAKRDQSTIPSMFGQPVSQLNTATDCQVVVYQNKLFVKSAAMLSLPILFYMWVCFLYFLNSICQRRTDGYWKLSRMKLFTLFLLSFTVFQPNIVSFLIQSISCRVIGEKKYVVSDVTMECYNDEHISVIMLASVGIFLWVVIVPAYIYYQLSKIKYHDWITIQYCYGFLYLEFKKNHIYWELLRLYLKLFVVLFVNLLPQSPITQFTCLSLTLFFYYHLVHSRSPYETLHMNKIDKQIIMSLTVQLVLNAIIKDVQNTSITQIVVTLVAVILNISTFSFLIFTILSQKIKFIQQNINKFKFKLQQIPCFSKFSFLQVPPETENNFSRFKHWIQLSNNLQYAIAQCQRVKYQQLRENYLLRSQQIKGAGTATGGIKTSDQQQQLKQSMGYDMMFKELDSINIKRGVSTQNTLNKLQSRKYQTAKSLYNGEQASVDGENSPQIYPQHIKDSNLNDNTNFDILNSIVAKDSKYLSQIPNNQQNSLPQYKLPKVSISQSNSPLQNSSSNNLNPTLLHNQNNYTEKASPFKLMHNGILNKQLLSNRSNVDSSPLAENDNNLLIQDPASLNNLPNTLNQISVNQISTQRLSKINSQFSNLQLLNNDDLQKQPSVSASQNTSFVKNNKDIQDNQEYEKSQFEIVGLKQYNSQINPKIISDDNLNQQYHPRNKNSKSNSNGSGSDGENYDRIILDDNDESCDRYQGDGSQQLPDRQIDSPNSNLPSQIDRYSFPTDCLMRISKR